MTAAATALAPDVVDAVRRSVRGVLEQAPGFQDSSPEQRRALAHKLVRVALAGAKLVQDEADEDRKIAAVQARGAAVDPAPAPLAEAASLVSNRADDLQNSAQRRAQDAPAGDYKATVPGNFSAANAAGKAIQDIKNAIDFPTYVSSLISGVFRAITESSIKQVESLIDLLDHVSQPAEDFAAAEVGTDAASVWAASRFTWLTVRDDGLAVRDGADLGDHKAELKTALAATDAEVDAIDDSDLLNTLLPLVRRKLGRDRQGMLATLIQLGLQRVVVDDGRLHASMDMRVDTRSALQRNVQDRQDLGIKARASASMSGIGWGAKASFGTDFASVHSDNQLTKEEIDTRAGLRSTVDLAFRTEQVPLDRLADKNARVKLDKVARVPTDVSASSILDEKTQAPGMVNQSSVLKDMKEMEPPATTPAPPAGLPGVPGVTPAAGKKPPAASNTNSAASNSAANRTNTRSPGSNNAGSNNAASNNAGANNPGSNNAASNNAGANNPGSNNAGSNNAGSNAGSNAPANSPASASPGNAGAQPPGGPS